MEAHAEQDITLVLMDKNVYDLSDGSGKCAAVVGMKDCLNEPGVMNSTPTSTGGWKDSKRRQWANNDFVNALPAGTRQFIKQVKTPSSYPMGESETTVETDDYALMLAEKEIFGSNPNSNASVEADLTQIEYYGAQPNRVKYANNNLTYWWEKSIRSSVRTTFCRVSSDGSARYDEANLSRGICMHMAI